MKYSFITDLSMENCIDKLKEAIIHNKKAGIYGKVKVNKNMFWVKKINFKYSNSFQRIFHGTFCIKDNKTLIQGSFKWTSFIKSLVIFIYLFISSAFTMTLYGLLRDYKIRDNEAVKNEINGVIFFVVFSLVVYFFVRVLTNMGKQQEQYLIEFIQKNLKAKLNAKI